MFEEFEFPFADVVKPPIMLIKEGQFPDCAKLFEEIISGNLPNAKLLGKRFALLCRLTGLAWINWLLNFSLVVTTGGMFLYHWGRGLDLSEHLYDEFTCKMFIAMLVATLFVGSLIYFALTWASCQLSEACRAHAKQIKTSVTE